MNATGLKIRKGRHVNVYAVLMNVGESLRMWSGGFETCIAHNLSGDLSLGGLFVQTVDHALSGLKSPEIRYLQR
jgi:hypothetical protein